MNGLVDVTSRFLKRNSSTILTCIGAVGVVATAILAAKAAPKATRLIEDKKEGKSEDLTRLETIAAVVPAYTPTVVTGIATVACIFGANTLNKRQQATLASAYALMDRSYKEYKNKVEELYGEEANSQIREGIAKDKYKEQKVPLYDGMQLFYDFHSGRYFESTMAQVIEAEYKLNQAFITRDYAYLNEFYNFLGIDEVPGGYNSGWSTGQCMDMYWESWITFEHETIILDSDSEDYEGLECTLIVMRTEPIIGFEDYC